MPLRVFRPGPLVRLSSVEGGAVALSPCLPASLSVTSPHGGGSVWPGPSGGAGGAGGGGGMDACACAELAGSCSAEGCSARPPCGAPEVWQLGAFARAWRGVLGAGDGELR